MLTGEAFVLGDWVSADDISPASAFSDSPEEIRESCLKYIYPGAELKGKVIVAGKNFGWGSYRESAALCLKYSGVVAVMAESFGYGMFRNLINLGIPALVGSISAEDGEMIEIDIEGRTAHCRGRNHRVEISDTAMEVLMKGGLADVL